MPAVYEYPFPSLHTSIYPSTSSHFQSPIHLLVLIAHAKYWYQYNFLYSSTSHFKMYLPSFLILSATVARVASAPFHFPTSDGFPQISPASLAQIEHEAGGSVPNGPLPTNLKPTGITILQLLAHNELLEVAFFTQLLTNITSNIPGYDAAAITPLDRNYVVKALTTIVAVSHLLPPFPLLSSLTHHLAGENPLPRRQCSPCQRRRGSHCALPVHFPRPELRRSPPLRRDIYRYRARHHPVNSS